MTREDLAKLTYQTHRELAPTYGVDPGPPWEELSDAERHLKMEEVAVGVSSIKHFILQNLHMWERREVALPYLEVGALLREGGLGVTEAREKMIHLMRVETMMAHLLDCPSEEIEERAQELVCEYVRLTHPE